MNVFTASSEKRELESENRKLRDEVVQLRRELLQLEDELKSKSKLEELVFEIMSDKRISQGVISSHSNQPKKQEKTRCFSRRGSVSRWIREFN